MGVVVTPSTTAAVPVVIAPIVQIKQSWPSLWQTEPSLLATGLEIASAGQDLSTLKLIRAYGPVKDTFEAGYQARDEGDLTDWWVRVQTVVAGVQDPQTVWIGRISGVDTEKFASSAGPSGQQDWVAYGPAQILHKRAVGHSFHLRDGDSQQVGWLPPLNDPQGSEVGTRSDQIFNVPATPAPRQVYLYGGTELWDYRQYAEYLVANFLDESASGGPEWYLAGDVTILQEFEMPIPSLSEQDA